MRSFAQSCWRSAPRQSGQPIRIFIPTRSASSNDALSNRGCLQGDRILSCSGEYRQQVVFVETTEKSFPSQTHLMCMLLPQQIECNVPHRSYICRGMVLPNAAAIFVEGHI